jgi:hypothetical protein
VILHLDLGAQWLRRAREVHDLVAAEIEARKSSGAPIIDESTSSPLVAPSVPAVSPLDGWSAAVRVLPYPEIVALEAEISSLSRSLDEASDDLEARARKAAECSRLICETQERFLRGALVSLSHRGEHVAIEDLHGDFFAVYQAVKSAQHLSRAEKKMLMRLEP